jgi:hypothetical protein
MPVLHASYLHETPALAMQFVNDCEWLAEEIVRMRLDGKTGSQSKLRAMGKSWFDEEIVCLPRLTSILYTMACNRLSGS